MIAIAMGKFGRQAREYDLTVTGDPFVPLKASGFKLNSVSMMNGANANEAQNSFQRKFGTKIE